MWICYVENFGCFKFYYFCIVLCILISLFYILYLLCFINLSYILLKNDILERFLIVVVCYKVDVYEFWIKCIYIVLFY